MGYFLGRIGNGQSSGRGLTARLLVIPGSGEGDESEVIKPCGFDILARSLSTFKVI